MLSRGVLALIAAIVGWVSVSDTLANVVVKGDASAALALAPWDGVIAADAAQAEISIAPTSEQQSKPAQLARKALKLNPTAVDALIVLGLQAQLRGDTDQAREIFTHSLLLSRRELRPQIWAIEEAVSRGDISGALRQYDIALRTSRRAPDIMFPVLAAAISEPKVRNALITLLKTKPVWSEAFIGYVGRGQIDPVAAVPFYREAEKEGLSVDEDNRTSLVNALAARGKNELAWDYYKTFRPADNVSSRDPKFSSGIDKPAVFDWITRSEAGISASIQRGRQGGMVEFSAAPSVGGVVLEQRQVLAPGTYKFEGSIEGLDQPERSRPYWILRCQNGLEVGRIPMPNSKSERVKVTGRFTVPPNCATQILSVVVRPSDEIVGVFGRIFDARLFAVRSTD